MWLKNSNEDKMYYYLIYFTFIQVISAFQPEFAEPIVNVSVAVGRDATFTCHVRHLGGYRVGWLKADTKAIQAIHEHVITHNPRVSVTHSDQNTWNLHIKAVTEEDRGGYMCQLNTDPMKSQIGYLDVVIPPDFVTEDTSSDVIVPEGSSFRLTCRARGYPEPIVTWRREDGSEIVLKDNLGTKSLVSSYRGEELRLTKISRSEMGSYLCIASNGVPPSVSKRISLSIHFHPVIQVPNQLVGAPLGTDVQIECHVEASPKSINYWIKDTGEMIVSSVKYDVQEISKSPYETKMVVIVKKFEKEDVGSYRCIAKNSLGEVDSSIRIYEINVPNRKNNKFGTETNDILKKQQKQKTNIKIPYPDDEDLYGSAEDFNDDDDDDNNNNESILNNNEKSTVLHQKIQTTKKPLIFSKDNNVISGNIGGSNNIVGKNYHPNEISSITRKPSYYNPDILKNLNNELSSLGSSSNQLLLFFIKKQFNSFIFLTITIIIFLVTTT